MENDINKPLGPRKEGVPIRQNPKQENEIIEFFRSDSGKEIITLARQFAEAKGRGEVEEHRHKRISTLVFAGLVVFAIVALAVMAKWNVIDNCTAGTLFGSIIGYGLSKFQGMFDEG